MAWGQKRAVQLGEDAARRRQQGHVLHHLELRVGPDTADLLEQVERQGWRLEHAGYVYEPHTLGPDLDVGSTKGMFTFRRVG